VIVCYHTCMNKIEMQLQEINREPMQEWFEFSCRLWANHYNFLLSLSWNTEAENVWYREQFNMNKIYDV
jgi:hypothetical protein